MKKLFLLVIVAAFAANSTFAYRIYFNKIICINPTGFLMQGREFNTVGEVLDLFQKQCTRPMEGDFWRKELTLYWDNKKISDVSYLSYDYLSGLTGEPNGARNDRFYITYKDKAREGMVLPLKGGDKNLWANAHWLPTAAEGNPGMAGGPSIRYYLWDANAIYPDKLLNYFSIDLPGKVNKGPQLVLMTDAGTKAPANSKAREKAALTQTSASIGVYVIEYEVKP